MELLEVEQWNLRSALARLPGIDPEHAALVAMQFSWFLIHRQTNLVEGRSWLERLLAAQSLSGETQVRLMMNLGYVGLAGDDEHALRTSRGSCSS